MVTADSAHPAVGAVPAASRDDGQEVQWASARSAGQAAVNLSEKALEEKERRLVESIQKNYGRIKDVERELASLQLQLRMNVGPKKHALEMLRRKIEVQTEKVQEATERRNVAKKVFEEAAEALASEERAKEQLCSELNMLVQQSAHAQLDKLDQLTQRLELLNSGIHLPDEAEASRLHAQAHPGEVVHVAAGAQQNVAAPGQQGAVGGPFDPTNPFLSGSSAQEAGASTAAAAAQPQEDEETRRQREEQEEQQRRQQAAEAERQRRQAEAEAARSRHVTIGRAAPGRAAAPKQQQRQAGPARGAARGNGGAGAAQPRVATDERGVFSGFE